VIVLSRELPPALSQFFQSVAEVRVDSGGDETVFDNAVVYCSTALDSINAELINRFPASLGLIANIGVGTDNIDLNAARNKGVIVSNTPVVTEDTADLTWALILAASRRLTTAEYSLRQGEWQGQFLPGATGQRVTGKTLGIVGLGAIGQAVARRAVGFNMPVIYHSPRKKQGAEDELGVVYRDSLDGLLGEADIISLHCPLNESTRHIINTHSLSQLKKGAILINTGRGPLVDENALIASLESGHLGAAGLDVFEFEPDVPAALLKFPNVTLLPHIGSATGECRQDMGKSVLMNIKTFLETGKVVNPVS
jgi:glyoxylate reductase